MSQELDKDVLNRFLNNQSSEQECEAVWHWLAQPENEIKAKEIMAQHWQNISEYQVANRINFESIKASIHQQIGSPPNAGLKISDQNNLKSDGLEKSGDGFRINSLYTGYLMQIAAGLSLVLLSAALIYFIISRQAAPLLTFTNSSGKTAQVQLPDGTKVLLNAQTTLKYPKHFKNQDTREVYLEGEAYFDVVKDKAHPFIVKTSAIQIRVLGTAFNLKSYPDDDAIETTLLEGKVAIARNQNANAVITELKPNQKAIFTRATEKITTSAVKAEKSILWQQGSFVFEDEPIENIIKALNRWYGIRIELENQQSETCKLTATIQKESLIQLLDILKITSNINYSIKNNKVFIKGAFCE